MTSRKKPDLAPNPAFWIDPDYLPDALRAELLLHLAGSPLSDDKKDELLRRCSELAQSPTVTTPAAKQASHLEAIASNARRLLASMNIDGDTRDVLATHARCDLGHDAEFLTRVWDAVHALEVAAEYTQQQMTVDRQTKPGQQTARNLVHQLAVHAYNLTGQMPPKDPASWFTPFAECLGKHLGLTVGHRIIKSVIDSAKPAR
ncbi:hypothetical protein [Ralstonia pseudosolanacearum]|uniref:hypothetical protein n=1 Tax=Ralstonia pseudosolanacearum TaxID=1310165 RepID=UPI003CF482B7